MLAGRPSPSACYTNSSRRIEIVGDHFSITENTVKSRMKSVMRKLRANDQTRAVLIALKRGFLAICIVAEVSPRLLLSLVTISASIAIPGAPEKLPFE